MNFEKAFKQLLTGKKIRRKAWEPNMHMRVNDSGIQTYKSEVSTHHMNADVFLTKDWKVLDGDGMLLTFMEALEELKLKKFITREGMGDSFLFIDNGVFAICKAVEYDFMPTFQCLCSNDWEVIQ